MDIERINRAARRHHAWRQARTLPATGAELAGIRLSIGLTQARMAFYLGRHETTYRKMEKGIAYCPWTVDEVWEKLTPIAQKLARIQAEKGNTSWLLPEK